MMKSNKKVPKTYPEHKIAFFRVSSLIRDVTCFKLSRSGENIMNQKLPVEHTYSNALQYN